MVWRGWINPTGVKEGESVNRRVWTARRGNGGSTLMSVCTNNRYTTWARNAGKGRNKEGERGPVEA